MKNMKDHGIMLLKGRKDEHSRDRIPSNSILEPEVLERINRLIYRARISVDGALSGLHKNYHIGQSVEFSQHKEYSQGDDLSNLDWKAYAKSDRYFIKQYDTETNTRCIILMDASASMDFGSISITKIDYARLLAASIAFLLLNQFDEVGLLIASGDGFHYISPHRGRQFIRKISENLMTAEPRGAADLPGAFQFIADRLSRGIVIALSDLIADEEAVIRGARYLHGKRNDMMVLQIFDPCELRFDFDEPWRFIGLEGEGEVQADPAAVRQAYISEITTSVEKYRKGFKMNGIDHLLIETSTPPENALSRLIGTRTATVQ
ncbi:MAG TPA: DUF58 domain-containing protein [bacterium]